MTLKKENQRAVSGGRLWVLWSILLVVGATLLRLLFLQGLGTNVPYITFYPAVAIAALYGGLRAGFLTLALSTAVAIYFWVEPMHTLTSRNPFDWLLLGTFLATTALISIVAEAMHRARARAHAATEREVAALAQREADERLRFALEQSQMGGWDLDLADHTVLRTLRHDQIFGYESLLPEWTYERFLEHVLPEDRAEVGRRFHVATATQNDWRFECRIRRQDGAVRWIWVTGSHQRDAIGQGRWMAGIVQDITERKEAEAKRAHLAAVVESSDDAIISKTLDGIIQTWNEGATRLFGYSASEAIGQHGSLLFPPGHEDEEPAIIARLKRGETISHYETQRRRKDGTLVEVSLTVSPIKDERGHIVGASKIVRDITERKQVEQELQKFFQLAESSSEFIGLCDLDLNPLYVNPAGVRMVGLPDMAAACRVKVQDYFFPEDQRFIAEEFFPRVLRDGDGDVEIRLRHFQTGEPIWMFYYLFSVREASGKPVGWATVSRDITERKQSEAALAVSAERLRLAVEGASLGTWHWDIRSGELTWSDRCLAIFGIPAGTRMSYEKFLAALHPEDRARADAAVQRALRVRSAYDIEFRTVWPDGTVHWAAAKGCAYYDEAGEPLRMEGLAFEITERKQAEAELAQHREQLEQLVGERTKDLEVARTAALSLMQDAQRQEKRVSEVLAKQRELAAQLQAANQELEAFSYSVSHDLRAPLRHVQGYVQMLRRTVDGQLSEKAGHYLQTISDASVEMGQLIDDLLAFSRMGRTELHETPASLDALVQDTVRGLEMATRGRHIIWKIAPLPMVFGDPSMLKQVLTNLIGNAVKYTGRHDEAEIEIGCAGEEEGRIIFFVRDNGAGFDMQYAHKLFGVFQRLHRADEFEGTGIGLATVRRIIARHGGRTWAEGSPGKGATFYFTLTKDNE